MSAAGDGMSGGGARGAGLPLGLLGALLLGLAFEGFVDRHRAVFMSSHELDWRAAGRDATGPAVRRAQVLLLGDSMVKFGLNPRVLQGYLGRRVYSMALLNGRPGAAYFLLQRAIAAGARPEAVVVDYQPEFMNEPTPQLLEQREWKGLLSLGECLDLARTYRDPDFFARAALARLLPSYRSRGEIGRALAADLRGEPRPNVGENAKVGRNRAVNRGGMVLAPNPGYGGDVAPNVLDVVAAPDWRGRPENTIYVRRLLRLAGDHGVRVVWLVPPNVPEIEATRDRLGVAERYSRFVRGAQVRYPNLDVIDARRSGFHHGLFVDAVHLDRNGAAALSRGVADVLRGWLGGGPSPPRWAALGAPRGDVAGDAVALEDVEQSKSLVSEGGVIRR